MVFLRISVLLPLNLKRASKYLSWTAVLHCLLFLFQEKKRLQGFLNEMLRCGCLKVCKNPLRFHPRSPNFQRFHISKWFANYYPASRGPSVFPSYLGRSKGPCSRGTCKLAKYLPRMGIVPCEQCLWGYGVAEELKCLEYFTGVQAQCMSIFPLYMYIVKLIGDRKSNKQMQFFSMYAWTCTKHGLTL